MCSVNALATFSDNTVSLLFMRMRVAKICPPIDKLKIVRSGGRLLSGDYCISIEQLQVPDACNCNAAPASLRAVFQEFIFNKVGAK